MQALVHFTVGVCMALAILVFIDRPAREEFLLLFASGFWGLLPDGHWMLREAGLAGPAAAWQAVHRSPVVNVFWFHHYLDSIETGRNNLEAGVSLAVLLVLVFVYYRYNEWTVV